MLGASIVLVALGYWLFGRDFMFRRDG
jgi:hypothetical protein